MSAANQLSTSKLIKYGTNELIDIEHYNRNFDNDLATKSEYQKYNHANFPNAFPGMDKVKGSCQGYWKNELKSGKTSHPTANCLIQSVSELGKWEGVANRCIRKTCPNVHIPNDPDVSYDEKGHYIVSKESYNGIFELDYGSSYRIDSGELGVSNDEIKGRSNGFATWRGVNVMDFDFNVEATACIPGYKEVDSEPEYNQPVTPVNFLGTDPRFIKTIRRYTDGKNPVRICSPHAFANEGFWRIATQ
jgi:hypothetical protein